MLDAAVKALSQMVSPPFRAILLKSVALALGLIVLIGIGLYRALMGEHDDWDDYRRSMVTDRRVVVRLTPTRAYGMLP